MSLAPPSMCQACKNFTNRRDVGVNDVVPQCRAYPGGIPFRFYYGGDTHTDPERDADNDIVFELDLSRQFALDAWATYWHEPVPSGIDEGEAVADQSTIIP